jgi:hypothetical protein
MQFKVPQFLDIEDTIFGPFTFKQFVYLAGGAGLSFVLYKLLGLALAIIPILLVVGFSLLLTFYRPNGKPFMNMVESGISYLMQNKLYVWKRRKVKVGTQKKEDLNQEIKLVSRAPAKLDSDKLKNLAWSLDVLDIKKKE